MHALNPTVGMVWLAIYVKMVLLYAAVSAGLLLVCLVVNVPAPLKLVVHPTSWSLIHCTLYLSALGTPLCCTVTWCVNAMSRPLYLIIE
jgi:hypothetical protein